MSSKRKALGTDCYGNYLDCATISRVSCSDPGMRDRNKLQRRKELQNPHNVAISHSPMLSCLLGGDMPSICLSPLCGYVEHATEKRVSYRINKKVYVCEQSQHISPETLMLANSILWIASFRVLCGPYTGSCIHCREPSAWKLKISIRFPEVSPTMDTIVIGFGR